jgi:hypothetical protein
VADSDERQATPNAHCSFAVKRSVPVFEHVLSWASNGTHSGRREIAPVNLLTVWGDPTNRASFTIDLFPLSDRFSQQAVRQVLVYASNYLEAVEIARSEGMRFELEPRGGGSLQRLN